MGDTAAFDAGRADQGLKCTQGLDKDTVYLHSLPPQGQGQLVGSVWLRLLLAVSPLPFRRDPGPAFSWHTRRSSQLSSSRDGRGGCQQEGPCQPSPLAAGAVPWLMGAGALQAEESDLECLWAKVGCRPPRLQVPAFGEKPGKAAVVSTMVGAPYQGL